MADLANALPMVRAIIENVRKAPSMDRLGIAASREAATKRTTAPAFEDVARVEDFAIGEGGEAINVRLYSPHSSETLPLLLFFHAGGWILGDLDHSDHLCRHLANLAQAAVVSVDYRLCPEVCYPAPLDDCERALRWAIANAAVIGADASRIGLLGESSGGNLAAALALRNGRLNICKLSALLLLTPALDVGMDTASWRELGDDYLPPRSQMRWMWDNYLCDGMSADAEASPALAATIPAGHPATFIVSAGFDPLRDEAQNYAELLRDAGIPIQYRCEEALLHAFSNLGGIVPEGLRAFDRAASEMGAALARPR